MTLSEPTPAQDGLSRPISALLAQLRTLMQAQAEAINNDSFDLLDQLNLEREPLVIELSRYTVSDLDTTDHALAEQVAALDQQLVQLTRESIMRTGQEIRDLDRGRAALTQYGQRGKNLIQNLAHQAEQD
jgi:hypothetical protein